MFDNLKAFIRHGKQANTLRSRNVYPNPPNDLFYYDPSVSPELLHAPPDLNSSIALNSSLAADTTLSHKPLLNFNINPFPPAPFDPTIQHHAPPDSAFSLSLFAHNLNESIPQSIPTSLDSSSGIAPFAEMHPPPPPLPPKTAGPDYPAAYTDMPLPAANDPSHNPYSLNIGHLHLNEKRHAEEISLREADDTKLRRLEQQQQQLGRQHLLAQQQREQHLLEQHRREQQQREQQQLIEQQQQLEHHFKEQQLKDQQRLKEQQRLEQQLREQQRLEQKLKEQQLQEQQLNSQQLHDHRTLDPDQQQHQQQYRRHHNKYDDVASRIVEQERLQKAKSVQYPKLHNYTVMEQMGEGAFSVVYKALHLPSNQYVAIKILRKFQMDRVQQAAVLKEVTIMRQLDHPNIVKFIEFIDSDPYYYIVQELAVGGEVFSSIVKYTYFSEDLTKHVISQLALAIQYLHEQVGVVHRDIKPENLLFMPIDFVPSRDPRSKLRASDDPNAKQDEGEFFPGIGGGGIGLVKLADFGLSKQIWEHNTKTPCGTVGYTAPEIVRDERYSKGVDMWAIGCVLYTLLCGFPPFYDERIEALTHKVARGEYTFLSPWWDEILSGAKNCVLRLLTVDPKKRYTILDLLSDPWLLSAPSSAETVAPALTSSVSPPLSQPRTFREANNYGGGPAGSTADRGMYSPAVSALREVFDISTAVQRMGEEAALQSSLRAPPLLETVEEEEEEGDMVPNSRVPETRRAPETGTAAYANRSAPRYQQKQQPPSAFIPPNTSGFDLNMGAATILGRRKQKQPPIAT